jgi:hypothetical protein
MRDDSNRASFAENCRLETPVASRVCGGVNRLRFDCGKGRSLGRSLPASGNKWVELLPKKRRLETMSILCFVEVAAISNRGLAD